MQLLLIFLIIGVESILACEKGFYQDAEKCLPCDSVCKEWTASGSWSGCEEYMFLNTTTNLCEKWPTGEYYDFSIDSWNSCGASWHGFWKYQTSWMQCSASEALDTENLQCVPDSSCDIADSPFNSGPSHYSVPKFWKRTDFYVDPTSSELLELGTKDYPYRTIQPVFAEILNEFSHSSESLNVYVKEGTIVFIDDSTSLIINIYELSITTYSELGSDPAPATLVTSEDARTHISQRALFHLMSDTSLDTAGVIAAGTFSETEQNGINKGGDTFYVSRSSFSISNFIVHRYALLDESVFVYLSYLQSKKFTMSKF